MSVSDSSVSSPVPNRDDYDIFISYSRRDKAFVSQLCEALTQANQKIWVDWNDIPPAEDWRQEIYRGIEAANNFVFIISPNSTSSVVCGEELDHAIKQGKRLVPIVRQNVGNDNVPSELGRINWIFFREDDDFDGAFRKLISAVETDLSHVREQTHLLVRARKWNKVGRNKSYLLQGSELKKAEQWLAESESKQPQATALHREYIKTSRQVETEREDAEMRLRRLTPQQVKNRQAILNKVRNFWVEGVLETSLHDQVLIERSLEERADAVVSSWNMKLATADEAQKPLPKGTKVISIFDQLGEGRTLLILGEPGAGKTTTLLELTRDLLNRAEQGLDYCIPVVFNLSSWADKKQTIADWLVEELNSKYQVPKQIGQDWVKKQELLLLLDGLDEVKVEHRESCVAAVNDFHQNYAPEMVVCSRIQDYSALSNRLNFQSAVYLRSLTPEQVRHYLGSLNADLTGLRALIEGDTALQELAKSLIFGLTSASGKAEIKTVETLEWSWKKAKNGLSKRRLIIVLIFGLILGLSFGPIVGLSCGLILGLFSGLINGMKGSAIATKTIPNQGIYRTARNAGIMSLIVLLISGLISGLINGLISGLFFGLSFGLMALILGGGKACIQHFTLRLILYRDGYIPWNYTRFLDYAAERIFLQKVGGGYIFIHRLLLEHFAQMELES